VLDLLAIAVGPAASACCKTPASPRPTGHGAGCTLSSAIAAQLALGLDLPAAVQAARSYVRQALAAGAKVRTGQGVGPLNHGFAPLPTRLGAL
jgi:hydroxymethylpyrimidine/phosphomethylpyrimidine kinase